jgi:glycyl-tRNA synthetase beta chain
MGNMLQKMARVESIAIFLSDKLNLTQQQRQNIQEAASFCYADLTSGVVYEFPELQGYMGCVYAQKAGFKKEVSAAIGEFYLPLSAAGELPQTLEGSILSLAGKIDTLAANFAAGQIPTGSEDPFALRRQAMGAVRIMLDKKLNITLQEIIDAAAAQLPVIENNQIGRLYDFMWQRFANILENDSFAQDEIAAVENLKNRTLCEIYTIVETLRAARKNDMLSALSEAAKRVGNIIRKSTFESVAVNPALFNDDAERELFKTVAAVKSAINTGDADFKITEEYCKLAFEELLKFKNPLENFFEKIMVNDPDAALKNNRLALLGEINSILTGSVADLGKLQNKAE